ncbi:MAG: BLUF domain-containing protein [Methylophilaceae bacterium]
MNYFTQIIYVSRATFPLSNNPYKVEPQVSDILQQSRANNRNRRLVGVLCFGEGYFLQCLQGKENDINELVEALKQDTRHTDIKVLSSTLVNNKSFSKWRMKYAGVGSDIQAILNQYNLKSFNPYQFSETVLKEIIQHLLVSA